MEYIEINEWNADSRSIELCVNLLNNGAVGILPTDSIYAFVCLLNNKKGIEQICKIVGKKPEKANLSLIFHDFKNISEYTQPFSTSTFKILKKYLPGPYTFILKANSEIPNFFLSNKKTIGFRIPDNEITQKILKNLDFPLVVASVHSEDEIIDYLTEPEEIYTTFQNKVDFIVSGGTGGNIPSTVVDLTNGYPELIREGKGEFFD